MDKRWLMPVGLFGAAGVLLSLSQVESIVPDFQALQQDNSQIILRYDRPYRSLAWASVFCAIGGAIASHQVLNNSQQQSASSLSGTNRHTATSTPPTMESAPDSFVADSPTVSPSTLHYAGSEAPAATSTNQLDWLPDALAANRLSIAVAAPPDTGKSTLARAMLAKVIEKFPEAIIKITGQKRDSWLGLRDVPGVFSQATDADNWEGFFKAIERAAGELNQRLNLDEQERRKQPKLILVIDDYFATDAALSASKKYRERWEDCKAKLGQIVTVGRDYLVSTWVFTHSLNLASLGLAKDANIRGCLSVLALGRVIRDEGRLEGSYDAISSVLNNRSIIRDAEQCDRIKGSLNQLKSQSEATGIPIALYVMADASCGLLPDLRWVENVKINPPLGDLKESNPTIEPTPNTSQEGCKNESP